MPGYPWYFEVKDKAGDADTVVPVPSEWAPSGNKVIIARQPARDLVQYLLTLRQTELRP
jgi:cytochrome c oxidase cbb3-type subunit 2